MIKFITHKKKQLAKIIRSSYINKKGINFSTNRFIKVTEKKEIEIELEFKQYNFNETLSFPFTVPKNYKRN